MDDIVCVECKYVGKPKMKKRGSGKLEFIGWALFPLGVPYSIWRMLAKTPVCGSCGGSALLPTDGVAGQRLIQIAVGERYEESVNPKLPKEPVLTKYQPKPVVQPASQPIPEPVYQPVPQPATQAPPVQQPAPSNLTAEESAPTPTSAPAPAETTSASSASRKDRLDPNVW